jgi:hypothetical protein
VGSKQSTDGVSEVNLPDLATACGPAKAPPDAFQTPIARLPVLQGEGSHATGRAPTLVGELGLEALVPGRADTAVDLRGASALALGETARAFGRTCDHP